MTPPGFLERTLDDQLGLLAQISRIPPKFQFPPIRIPELDATVAFFCNFLLSCETPVLSLSGLAFLRCLRRSYLHFFTDTTIPLFLVTLRHCCSNAASDISDATLQMIGDIAHDSHFGAKLLLEFADYAFARAISDSGSDHPTSHSWSPDPVTPLLDNGLLRIGPLFINLSRPTLESVNPGLFAFHALFHRCSTECRLPFRDLFEQLWEYLRTHTVYFSVLISALLVIRDLGRAAPASFFEAIGRTQLEIILVQFLALEADDEFPDLSPIQIPVLDILSFVCSQRSVDCIPITVIARYCRSGWLQSSAIACISAILSNTPDLFLEIDDKCPGWLAVLLNRMRVSPPGQLECIAKVFAVCIPQCREEFGFDILEFLRFVIEVFEQEDPQCSFWFLVAIDRLLEKLALLGRHEELFCPTFEYCNGRSALVNLCSVPDTPSHLTDLVTAFFGRLDGLAAD
jgi:hypothetical protein